jgi:chaperonin GroES
LGDRILVRKAAVETQTASGIFIPTTTAKAPNEAEVVAVGRGLKDVNGVVHPPQLQKGDKVLLPNYGGSVVEIGGEELVLYREDDIMGKFE